MSVRSACIAVQTIHAFREWFAILCFRFIVNGSAFFIKIKQVPTCNAPFNVVRHQLKAFLQVIDYLKCLLVCQAHLFLKGKPLRASLTLELQVELIDFLKWDIPYVNVPSISSHIIFSFSFILFLPALFCNCP